MAISIFLSAVSDEFRSYRNLLNGDLTRQNVSVKVQEDFKNLGGDTLDKLDVYIACCDAVVHLVGDMCGAAADQRQQQAVLAKHSDLLQKLPPLGEALNKGLCLPYTQWEAWLALYRGKPLMIAKAIEEAPRGPNYAPTDASSEAQVEHLKRLKAFDRYALEFTNPDNLAKQIFASWILDLLAKDYAQAHEAVAEGFIAEMSKRVAHDKGLDLCGMMEAVRNAIDIYEKEIAGRPIETNLEDIVRRALARAKEQVDRGQARLAGEGLFRAAEQMQLQEEERRERYLAGQTALYHRARDTALAAYNGGQAADATIRLARSVYGQSAAKISEFLNSEAQTLYEVGEQRGSNVHLVSAIALRRERLALVSADERGKALNDLGLALWTLGERENGTDKLEEAVAVFRAALRELTRERVPLDWAAAQNNLGLALWRVGERKSGTAQLEEAAAAFQEAIRERKRERVPLDWAESQDNLGNALHALGERENGTTLFKDAVQAYRAALEERTRARVPLEWAATQSNLADTLRALGERLDDTALLEEAVATNRAALWEWMRERVPLDWAMAQNNLGDALLRLGNQDSETTRLEEAVAAYHEALKEWTRERVPLDWAESFGNQGIAMLLISDRTNDVALAKAAAQQIEAAYEALRSGGEEPQADHFEAQLPKARAICDRLKGK
jgi:tetratricopeptide (TPR) repeat protein